MNKIQYLNNLLNQIQTISDSYERLTVANGEKFNIFSILRVETDEVKTHSRLLAELLNPNGAHGFNSLFLDLFIKTLNIDTKLNVHNSEVFVEKYVGKVTEFSGGNIDILIQEKGSNENVIMIENKIYAGEQPEQLLRYHNAYKNGKLLFLTLSGYESSQETSKNIPYECISYKEDIIKWLEACRKEAVNTPILRETLTQYINLIKKLTHQNINSKMNKDIVKLLINNEANFDAYKSILNIQKDIKNTILEEKIIPSFKELKSEIDGFQYIDNIKEIDKVYTALCWVENKKLKDKNLKILFEFQSKNTNHLIGGYVYLDPDKKNDFDYNQLQEEFTDKFKGIPIRMNDKWIYFYYWYFMNWENNILDLQNLIFGNFKEDIKYKIETMLNMIDESF